MITRQCVQVFILVTCFDRHFYSLLIFYIITDCMSIFDIIINGAYIVFVLEVLVALYKMNVLSRGQIRVQLSSEIELSTCILNPVVISITMLQEIT